MRVAHIGRTSFQYEYEMVDAEGRTVLTAKTVQVMYDYAAEKPVPIPDGIRALLSSAGEPYAAGRTVPVGMVQIFGKDTCPYTQAARDHYAGRGVAFEYRNVKKDPASLAEMLAFT